MIVDLPVSVGTACRSCPDCSRDTNGCSRLAQHEASSTIPASEHVLSTLDRDGSRRWLFPRLATGKFWHRRRWFGYALIAFFVTLPHLRIAGKPPLLLDIPARQLIVMGSTFLPTDTLLLALGMLGGFLVIMSMTTLAGRVWCGWACPQTVYMEFLFRPIDRWFQRTRGHGGKPRQTMSGAMAVARLAIYLLLAMALAHTFLSYFVGTDRLSMWIRSSPLEHPLAFIVMIGTTIAMLFDFVYFREQLCLIACPYGRFQSVMLDRRSLIVGYDMQRGEPRGRLKRDQGGGVTNQGDCVDCKLCVAVCPTGIDIRNGLQMECINCTQCIDACDAVMEKIGKPNGLIRYSSQDSLSGQPSHKFRLRLVLYPTLLGVVIFTFLGVLASKSSFDTSILRGTGNPYSSIAVGRIQNSFKLRIVNRSEKTQTYQLEPLQPESVVLEVVDAEKLTMNAGQTFLVPLSVSFPATSTALNGRAEGVLMVTDSDGVAQRLDMQLLGPKQ